MTVNLVKEEQKLTEHMQYTPEHLKQVFKSSQFKSTYGMMFFVIWFTFYMAISYKAYGQTKGISDMFLTVCGSTASLVNACARLVGGILMEYYSFKKIFSVVLIVQFILCLSFDYIATTPAIFLVCLCLNNAV